MISMSYYYFYYYNW